MRLPGRDRHDVGLSRGGRRRRPAGGSRRRGRVWRRPWSGSASTTASPGSCGAEDSAGRRSFPGLGARSRCSRSFGSRPDRAARVRAELAGVVGHTKVVVISLPDAADRRATFTERARGTSLGWSWFDAHRESGARPDPRSGRGDRRQGPADVPRRAGVLLEPLRRVADVPRLRGAADAGPRGRHDRGLGVSREAGDGGPPGGRHSLPAALRQAPLRVPRGVARRRRATAHPDRVSGPPAGNPGLPHDAGRRPSGSYAIAARSDVRSTTSSTGLGSTASPASAFSPSP